MEAYQRSGNYVLLAEAADVALYGGLPSSVAHEAFVD